MRMKKTEYRDFAELPLLLSVPELAGVLGISRSGAYELVKERGSDNRPPVLFHQFSQFGEIACS